MTAVADSSPAGGPGLVRGLWQRQIDRYPDDALRYTFLGIVVAATIVLYYELYVGGAVAPSILQFYDISFNYYVLILVFGNALGALASLAAGLADRWGRANLVAYGLLLTGVLTAFALPNAGSGFTYGVFYALVSIVEGMVLVATPALVRDYSPQVGRATAMGFWTLGPVIGSLVVTEVSSHSFTAPLPGVAGDWQGQYRICGIVGLIVWVVAFVGLRELSPKLRDQLMVSMHDRVLVEARAKSLDVEALESHHFASVARPNIVASAFGVSVFLIIYYTAVAFAVIYLVTVFTVFSGATGQTDANNLLNWWWGTEAVALVVIGLVSDRLLVRKPMMLVGGIGTIVMTFILMGVTGHPDTSYDSLKIIAMLLGLFISLSYAPWMAAFTETVEDINPAATAAGLAIWGLIIRTVVSVSFLLIPHAVGSVTPIVDHGSVVQAAVAKVPPQVLAAVEQHQKLFATLAQYPANQVPADVLRQAITELGGGPQALQTLQAVAQNAAPLAVLSQYGADVQKAQADAPGEWQHWLWICIAGQVVFVPMAWVLFGRWSPRKAREDEAEHEKLVAREMAELGLSQAT